LIIKTLNYVLYERMGTARGLVKGADRAYLTAAKMDCEIRL
jgi:hypothetical protein